MGVFLIEVQKQPAYHATTFRRKKVSLTTQRKGLLETKLRGPGPNSTLWGGDTRSPWLWCCLGVSLGSAFPPDSLSAPGVCPPRLYGLRPAIHPGNSMLSLNGAATPCVTWDQGTSRENPVPVGPVSFPNHLLRLASFQIPGTCHCSPTFRWP